MNFKSADKVNATINASDSVERIRAENRNKVNEALNGFPPLDDSTASKIGMKINVNWMEFPVMIQHAVQQLNNALTRQNQFFKVKLPTAPSEHADDWGLFITQMLARPMKESGSYYQLIRSKSSAVVAHGIAPQTWTDQENWEPEFVAIGDLRIPTDTEVSLKNLPWFAIRKRLLPGELARKSYGKYAMKGWDKKVIANILNYFSDKNLQASTAYDWSSAPEKMMELWKQNMGFYMSDAVPTVSVWNFYYLDDSDRLNTSWKLKVVPAEHSIPGLKSDTFLFESDDPVASKLSEILQINYGDLSGNPPFMHHAVRSLGLLLLEPCYWMNLSRCRLLQHVWENFNILLRGADPTDRAHSQKVELFDRGWLPNDVQIVPKEQRHQIDSNLLQFAMSQMKQLMQDASTAYTQDIDTGTSKERTAFEVMTVMQSVNAMMNAILNTAYHYEGFACREICRRFCNRKSLNPDIREFQLACKREGIPRQWLDVKFWDVTPDFPMGAGNQTLELAQAQQLMGARPAYGGAAQQKILHLFSAAVTNNSRLAVELAPLDEAQAVSSATRDAESVFGTLMQGVPVHIKDGLSPIDQIETLLGLMSGVIAQCAQTGMADQKTINGLNGVNAYVTQLIAGLEPDDAQADRVKVYSDTLGKLMNDVKAFAQRLQEQAQAGNGAGGLSPEAQAKVAETLTVTHAKLEGADAVKKQKLMHKQEAFEAEQKRKDLATVAEQQRAGFVAGAEVGRSRAPIPKASEGE